MIDTVLLPGSYDPPTSGHFDIIRRCAALYASVHVVIFVNPVKHYLFPLESRLSLLRLYCRDLPGVTVDANDGMVIDYAARNRIRLIVKGIRNEEDATYEYDMAEYNRTHGNIETVFMPADPAYATVSSTRLRTALASGTSLTSLVPAGTETAVYECFKAAQNAR